RPPVRRSVLARDVRTFLLGKPPGFAIGHPHRGLHDPLLASPRPCDGRGVHAAGAPSTAPARWCSRATMLAPLVAVVVAVEDRKSPQPAETARTPRAAGSVENPATWCGNP